MDTKHGSEANGSAGSMVIPTHETNLGDIFICGTTRACAVKNCFKRNTHYHCSLCPDRRLVKEQNMVAHQIFHVNGRLEKRSIRDNHFTAYSGKCGRSNCRFDAANKKHHHCKMCDWPCCGRKLQRCSGHIKSKHPDVFREIVHSDSVLRNTPSPKKKAAPPASAAATGQASISSKAASNIDVPNTINSKPIGYNVFLGNQPLPGIKYETELDEPHEAQFSDDVIRVERSDELENIKVEMAWSASNGHQAASEMRENVLQGSKIEVDDIEMAKDDISTSQSGFLASEDATPSCEYPGCVDFRSHFHCNICEFVTNKKILLERHQNVHARGFHEKRKQREMYFTGSTGPCGFKSCRFGPLKQRHFHCKFCNWACSSRKLQRCIKHISDKHRIEMNLDMPEEVGPPSPQSSQSPPTTTTYSPSLDNAAAGPSEDVKDNTIPLEDDLFFVSYAGIPCDVDKCLTDGLHYHCKRCPFVTKQKQARVRHRTIHLKGYPERRRLRDQHFSVYDGFCGRTCRFSMPKRKHFHCKHCDWPCCARKMPRCLNHLKRKHCEVLNDEEENSIKDESSKKVRTEKQDRDEATENGRQLRVDERDEDIGIDTPNRVIVLEGDNDCPFIIKDVHSLRDGSEERPNAILNGRGAEISSHRLIEAENRMEARQPVVRSYEKSFKQYKRPSNMNGPIYVNGHGFIHHPERPIVCRVCRAFANERLPLRKMVVYSSSSRVELDLRLTSLLCTYFRISIEDAFNSYICERDFEDWCNFHAQKISVYPVIAVENGYETMHNSQQAVPVEEHYSSY